MTSIAISVPKGIAVADARKACLEALRELKRKRRESDWRDLVLRSDRALKEWEARNCFDGPVVRASAYPDERIPNHCEFQGFALSEDPRRPVIQLGSRYNLHRRYSLSYYRSSPNGWCRCVYGRWLRRIRYTSFAYGDDISGNDELVQRGRVKLMRKHGADGRGWDCPVASETHGTIWLNGKRRYSLTPHQINYIRKLWITAHKIGALEKAA